MRKVVSFVLVLALVLGSFSMAFAADTTATTAAAAATSFSDVEGTAYEDAVSVLSALNVVAGYPDGTYKPAQTVTRAEMAKLIIAELGLESSASGATTNFTDMSGYGWAAGYVGYSQSLGIIEGYGDGTFRPGKTVSYDEAITMIVRAIGYTESVKEMNGTWPAVFTQKARVLGITDDVTAGGSVGANRGDIAIMLYNALTCNMGYADADGVFVNKEDKDGYVIKMITNLNAEEQGYAIITKSDADDALINITKYIGAYAKTFTVTKGKNEDCIIAMSDVKSTFITGEFKAGTDKVLKAADGTEYKLDDVFTYGVAGTSTVMSKDKITAAYQFLNGDTGATNVLTDTTGSAFVTSTTGNGASGKAANGTFVTLAADLSGKTVKGVFSVLQWNVSAEAVVDKDDIADIESNHSLLGKDFAENDDDAIDLTSFELYGVKSLSDIKDGNVVYVYENSDDEIVKVDVGTEVVSGEVTKVKDGKEITIGGKTYKLSAVKLEKNDVNGELQIGDIDTEDVVELYLDAYGYAYDSDTTAGAADTFGIVLDLGTKTVGKISDSNQVKLFTNTGDDIVFDVDDDLFDVAVTGSTIIGGWAPALTPGSFMKYGLDKKGVIDDIEWLDGAGYETVTASSMTADKHDLTSKGYYDGHAIKSNAVIFTFDSTMGAIASVKSDEDNYDVVTLDSVLGEEDVVADYILDGDKIVAMLIYDFSSSDAMYGVVTDRAKNSSDAGYEIEFWIDKKSVTYNAAQSKYSSVSAAADGAGFVLWKIELDATGDVKELTDAWTDTGATGDTYDTASVTVISADATNYSSRILTVTSAAGISASSGAIATKGKITLDSDAVVYYNDNGDFKVGSLSDLRTLKDKTVLFYDVVDEDGVFDVVLIQ